MTSTFSPERLRPLQLLNAYTCVCAVVTLAIVSHEDVVPTCWWQVHFANVERRVVHERHGFGHDRRDAYSAQLATTHNSSRRHHNKNHGCAIVCCVTGVLRTLHWPSKTSKQPAKPLPSDVYVCTCFSSSKASLRLQSKFVPKTGLTMASQLLGQKFVCVSIFGTSGFLEKGILPGYQFSYLSATKGQMQCSSTFR